MSSKASLGQLPQEIVDCVIDQLHGDLEALKACSLVCRAWVFFSSRQIFRTFRPFSRFREEEAQLAYGRDGWTHMDFTVFSELLTSPRVALHVRCLELRPWSGATPLVCPFIEDFALIMTLLPSLRELRLNRCLPITQECPYSFGSLWDLQKVWIRDYCDTVPRLFDLLTGFRRIGTLQINNPRRAASQEHRELPPVRAHLAHVETFVVIWRGSCDLFTAFLEGLQRRIDFARVENLVLHNAPQPPLLELLERSSNLKTMSYLVGPQPLIIPATCPPCSVTIAGFLTFVFSSNYESPPEWGNILRDLEHLSSNPRVVLSEIILRIDQNTASLEGENLRSFQSFVLALDWPALRNILRRHALLKKISVVLQIESSMGRLGELGENVPRCHAMLEDAVEKRMGEGWRALVAVSVVLGPDLVR